MTVESGVQAFNMGMDNLTSDPEYWIQVLIKALKSDCKREKYVHVLFIEVTKECNFFKYFRST